MIGCGSINQSVTFQGRGGARNFHFRAVALQAWGLGDEVIQKLKQLADIVYKF